MHSPLYVCKSFHKVDQIVIINPNREDHQKWSIVSLNRPTLYSSTKTCGYHPHPSFTFYLEGLWVTISCVKCYECFISFILSCMQLDQNVIWRINWWNKIKFYWFLIHRSPLSNLAYLIFLTIGIKSLRFSHKKFKHLKKDQRQSRYTN